MERGTTIRDVAAKAGVSISVVSYVLNDTPGKRITPETRKRVLDAAGALHYVPNRAASGLRTRRAMRIGIVCHWGMRGLVSADLMEGITAAAAKFGYRPVLCCTADPENEFYYLDWYRDGTIDGLLFIAPHEEYGSVDELAHIAAMQKAGIPFVMVGAHVSVPGVYFVDVDFRGSTRLAANWLLEHGHEKVTYIAPNYQFGEYRARLHGYLDAMAEHGCEPDVCDLNRLDERLDSLRAVVTNKCDTALKVIRAARGRGWRIPDRFPLISANSEEYCSVLTPSLSSVLVASAGIGETAVTALVSLMQGSQPETLLPPPCRLILRETCPSPEEKSLQKGKTK